MVEHATVKTRPDWSRGGGYWASGSAHCRCRAGRMGRGIRHPGRRSRRSDAIRTGVSDTAGRRVDADAARSRIGRNAARIEPHNVWSQAGTNMLSATVKGATPRVYVPHDGSGDV